VDRDNSVGKATRYGLDGPGIEFRWWRDFPRLSSPALWPSQPPIQWLPGLSRGKRPGRGVDNPLHLEPRLKKEYSYRPTYQGPGVHPVSYTIGTGSFRGANWPRRGVEHPAIPINEVKGREELYIYSPSGRSWLFYGKLYLVLLFLLSIVD
jgi:hypothetical protein